MGNIKINLFDLINEEEKRIRCWIMAKGENLNEYLKLLIEKSTIVMGTKKELTRYFQNKFNISRSVSERFVFLMKEWHPLILMKELTTLTNTSYLEIQEYIDFLKLNQPPVKIYRAVKELSKDLCKIAGAHAADGTMNKNFFSITDGYKSDILAFNKWLKNTFGVEYDMKKISDNEWGINFHSSVICTYLREIFNFPSGIKVYGVSEPQIIKNAPINFRKNFALGALTFEAGVGMRNQVELCVFSKAFRDSIAEILSLLKIKFTNMENQSNGYWRLWSNKLSREDAKKWMELFEPKTEKWFKLNDYLCGFQGKVNSFEEASEILNKVYPSKEASKICLKDSCEY